MVGSYEIPFGMTYFRELVVWGRVTGLRRSIFSTICQLHSAGLLEAFQTKLAMKIMGFQKSWLGDLLLEGHTMHERVGFDELSELILPF